MGNGGCCDDTAIVNLASSRSDTGHERRLQREATEADVPAHNQVIKHRGQGRPYFEEESFVNLRRVEAPYPRSAEELHGLESAPGIKVLTASAG